MPRCHECGATDVYRSENNPDILISQHTGEGHRCDPRKKRVPAGKWRGYSYEDMARLWWSKKQADENVRDGKT